MSPVAFYLSLVQARLMGQVYHQAQRRLSSVPAVSEAPPAEPEPVVSEVAEERKEEPAIVLIETLELSTRVVRVLQGAGITTVGQVLERLAEGDAALLSIRGVGVKALEEIKAKLAIHGFLDS
jgi:DNA-directed RNA polymerase alpha subunit